MRLAPSCTLVLYNHIAFDLSLRCSYFPDDSMGLQSNANPPTKVTGRR